MKRIDKPTKTVQARMSMSDGIMYKEIYDAALNRKIAEILL